MKILAIYRHYWPDATPYGKILRVILEHLAESGHEVVAYTAQPAYNDVPMPRQPWRERLGGVDVIRIRLLPERKRWTVIRALNYLIFLIRALGHVFTRSRYDLVIANTFPPILNGLALRVIRSGRRIPYVYHCQDIHPESARLAGKLRAKWLYRWLLRADRQACERAERVLTLSDDMRDSLVARGIAPEQIRVVNNPPLDNFAGQPGPLPAVFAAQGVFRIFFAGNLGPLQGLDLVIDAAHKLADQPQIQFVFMGEGGAKRRLIERAGELVGRTVHFEPFQPIAVAWAAMQAADLGIVCLWPDLYRCAFPSKSMNYLSAGCPLLAIIEEPSELARTVRKHDLGYVVSQRDPERLAEKILEAWRERDRWTPEKRQALRQAGEQLYGRQRMCAAWDSVLAELAPSGHRG